MGKRKIPLWSALVLSLVLAGGCGTTGTGAGGSAAAAKGPVWPAPPARPRIRYLRSIATPADLGIRQSLGRNWLARLSGSRPVHFVRPTSVADSQGRLYVADPGARALWILDPTQQRVIRVRQVGKSLLRTPVAVAVRADGVAFVADSTARRVYRVGSDGRFLGIAAEAGLQRPAGLAWDERRGRLYVVDSAGHRVLAYDRNGDKLFSWGVHGAGVGEFNYPTYATLDRQGHVLVTDSLNFRIQAFDADGHFLWQFGSHGDTSGSFALPKGVAVDSDGHVYVVDALFDAVQIFRPDGTLLLGFGRHGSGPGRFWLPAGIWIDAQDRIHVVDTYNHRVQVFQYLRAARQDTGGARP